MTKKQTLSVSFTLKPQMQLKVVSALEISQSLPNLLPIDLEKAHEFILHLKNSCAVFGTSKTIKSSKVIEKFQYTSLKLSWRERIYFETAEINLENTVLFDVFRHANEKLTHRPLKYIKRNLLEVFWALKLLRFRIVYRFMKKFGKARRS